MTVFAKATPPRSLILGGDFQLAQGSTLELDGSYSKNFENPLIRKSAEFERILFNQKDYIEKNSYITGHDNVNVFGQIEMKYFIKANDNAIDIQLRKFNT